MTEAHPNDYRAHVLIALAVALIVNGAVVGWAYSQYVQQPTVSVSDITKPLVTELCPGDELDYRFTLNITKPGTVDVGTSYHSENSLRPSYVRLQQFIFTEPASFVLVRHSVIPRLYTDPATGEDVPWVPGEYAQRTVVNIEGHSTGGGVLEVPFTIRSDCTGLGG